MKKLLLAAVASFDLLGISAPASTATTADWYFLDFRSGVCRHAAEYARKSGLPELQSPQDWADRLRRSGDYSSTQIKRRGDGSIAVVEINDNAGFMMIYLADRDTCEALLSRAVRDGRAPKPGELE